MRLPLLTKEIMEWSRFRTKFLNTKSKIDRKAYNKQRNYCGTLIRIAKPTFVGNINTTDVTNNKTFRKKVKPFFTDKVMTRLIISLIEKKEVRKKDRRR